MEGLVLVYVDDVMIFSNKEVVGQGLQSCRQTWETSVRNCGLEISRVENNCDFFASQCTYLKEVLRWHSMDDVDSTQVMRSCQEPEDELDKDMMPT